MVMGHCSRLVGKDAGASSRRKEGQPSSSSKKRQKTYASNGPQEQGLTTRAKVKVNHPRVGDTLELLASQGRERVSIATILDILDEIIRGGKDSRDMG